MVLYTGGIYAGLRQMLNTDRIQVIEDKKTIKLVQYYGNDGGSYSTIHKPFNDRKLAVSMRILEERAAGRELSELEPDWLNLTKYQRVLKG